LFDLVHYEIIEGLDECMQREKQLKNWHRDWKIHLIKEDNPEKVDLAADWYVTIENQLVVASGMNRKVLKGIGYLRRCRNQFGMTLRSRFRTTLNL
jgi:hypothetical protein